MQRDLPYEVSGPALRTLGQTVSVPSEAPYFGAHYRVTQVGASAIPHLLRPGPLQLDKLLLLCWSIHRALPGMLLCLA